MTRYGPAAKGKESKGPTCRGRQPSWSASRCKASRALRFYGLFVIAVLQYYYLQVALEVLAQPTLTVFVPTMMNPAKPYL